MTTTTLPTFDDLAMLPSWVNAKVTDAHIDGNGHMNVAAYFAFAIEGAEGLVRSLGIDDDYRSQRQFGLFAAQHHLGYHAELTLGDRVEIRAHVLDHSSRTMHKLCYVVDTDRRRLACTLEILSVHVSLETRRAVAWPDDVARRLDPTRAAALDLPWTPPTCGAMAIRHED